MSELMTTATHREGLRWQLLTTVCALTLLSYVTAEAAPENADRPAVWIELGGQLERLSSGEQRFEPPFAVRAPRPDFEKTSPLSLLKTPRYAVGGEGKITFEPSGTDWAFTAAVRYGRSNGNKHMHNQTYVPRNAKAPLFPDAMLTPGRFEDVRTDYKESHTVLDFAVGKDVGLGLFGNSVASVGVRYAQFSLNSTVSLSSKPDYITKGFMSFGKYVFGHGFHNYQGEAHAERNFRGIGPSLSLTGSAPLSGNEDGGVAFDWGVNAAMLFGRQRTTTAHNTYGRYKKAAAGGPVVTYTNADGRVSTRSVTVPNLGGFAGLSMRYPNAKVSFGYRADVYFGAMDTGLDQRNSRNRAFYGPFATIAIGLGG